MAEEQTPQAHLNMVERAEAAVKAMQEQNDRAEAIAKRNEEAASRMMLGGGTTGNIPAEKPKEETAKEYSERVLKNNISPVGFVK